MFHGGLKIKTNFIYLLKNNITLIIFFISLVSLPNQSQTKIIDSKKVLEDSVFSIESYEHGVTANAFFVNFKNNTWVFTNAHVCGGREQALKKDKKYYFLLNGNNTSYYRYISSNNIIFDKKNDLCSFPLSKKIEKRFLTFPKKLNVSKGPEDFRMVTKFKGHYEDFKSVKVIDKDCTSIYSCENSRSHQKGRNGNMITNLKIKQGMSGSPIVNEKLEVSYIAYGRLEYRVGSFRDVYGLIQGGRPLEKFINRVEKADTLIKNLDTGFLFLLVKNKNAEGVVVTI